MSKFATTSTMDAAKGYELGYAQAIRDALEMADRQSWHCFGVSAKSILDEVHQDISILIEQDRED